MKRCSFNCFNVCEAALVVTPAFGAGVLLGLFMPPCILCGVCALVLLGTGALCIISK